MKKHNRSIDEANTAKSPQRQVIQKLGYKAKQPNWAIWKKTPKAKLWEVVALSCNMDPSDMEGWNTTRPAIQPPREFLDQLRLAVAGLPINGGSLVCDGDGSDGAASIVELGNFRAWATSLEIPLSKNFPQFSPSNPPHETEQQRALRLTRALQKDRAKVVAAREFNDTTRHLGITVSRLYQIVGTKEERLARLKAYESSSSRD